MEAVDDRSDIEDALYASCREMSLGFDCLALESASIPATGRQPWRKADQPRATTPTADECNEDRMMRLVEELAVEYGDVAEPALVDAEVRTEYTRLCRDSQVTDFVAMLTERTVRNHLNGRFRCHARSNAGASPGRLADLQSDTPF